MTPHPSTVKAAREIANVVPHFVSAGCDDCAHCVPLDIDDLLSEHAAALIEESCHVSEMVEALRAVSHIRESMIVTQGVDADFGYGGRTALENLKAAEVLLKKVHP